MTCLSVTGGLGTLALSAARALLDHGLANLALLDLPSSISSSTTSTSLSELQTAYPSANIHAFPIDVTSPSSIASTFSAANASFSPPNSGIDILACFAGIVGCEHASRLDPAAWAKVLEVNLTGAYLCAREAHASYFAPQKRGGAVLLIASISGHRVNYPQPQAGYNVSKAGVLALKDSLAAEWAVDGVRVNSLSPGYMDTILNEGAGLDEARNVWKGRCPMGRMGALEELQGAVVFACSRRAGRYLTGADLRVDGGMCIF